MADANDRADASGDGYCQGRVMTAGCRPGYSSTLRWFVCGGLGGVHIFNA